MYRVLLALIMFFLGSYCYADTRNVGDDYQLIYSVLSSSGSFVPGQSISLRIKKVSNGAWYDFSTQEFLTSGWESATTSLSEDSVGLYYYYTFQPPTAEELPEQYVFVVDNASDSYRDHQLLTVDYLNANFNYASNTVEISSAAVARAVWEAPSASYSSLSTQGGKLSLASAAGDPWSVTLPGDYATDTAGYLMWLINLNVKRFR